MYFSATAVLPAFWADTAIISLSGVDLLQSWRLLRFQLMSVTTQRQSPRCLLRNKANRRSAKAISPFAKFDDTESIFREQQLHFFKQFTTLQNDLSNRRCILKGFHQNPCCKSAWEHVGVGTCPTGHASVFFGTADSGYPVGLVVLTVRRRRFTPGAASSDMAFSP